MSQPPPLDPVSSDQLLMAARGKSEDLAGLGESLAQQLTLDPYFEDPSVFPGATLLMLERWAAQQFVGALVLLERPPVSHSAVVLLRGIVEAYAHGYWIAHGTGTGADSRACRALCFERGAAKEMRDAIANAAVGVASDVARAEAADRVLRIDRLRRRIGCQSCSGRDHGDVLPTIRQISKASGVIWLEDMVRSTRMAAHQMQPDRLLRLAEDGTVEIGGPAGLRERAALLTWLTQTYANLLEVVAKVMQPHRAPEVGAVFAPAKVILISLHTRGVI